MTALLQLGLAPIATVVLAVWAGLLALAAEGDPRLPRALTVAGPGAPPVMAAPRGLHLVHLALLVLAAAAGGTAVAWWAWSPVGGAIRLLSIVLLVWVVGDLLPRVTAAIAPRELLEPLRRAGARSIALFAPLLRLMVWADQRAGRQPATDDNADRMMLAGVFSLRTMTVAEVMTPRIDIVAVDLADSVDDVRNVFRTAGYARVVVYQGQADAVVGVLYAKDLLHAMDADAGDMDWHKLVRGVTFVPEAKSLDRQLRDFLSAPSHLMVVVDEFGGTAGLVTLEDILEQIVGEIHDERDVDEVEPIQPGETQGILRVLGGVSLAELGSEVGRTLERQDVDTVGGLVLALLGRVPRVGDEVRESGLRLHVDQVVRRRVKRVTVTVEDEE